MSTIDYYWWYILLCDIINLSNSKQKNEKLENKNILS